jgi:hypothetical protein
MPYYGGKAIVCVPRCARMALSAVPVRPEIQYSPENESFRRKLTARTRTFQNFRIFAGCLPEFAL